MQPMQLHWAPRLWGPRASGGPVPLGAPRHGVWVDYSFYQIHFALENSVETPHKFHC